MTRSEPLSSVAADRRESARQRRAHGAQLALMALLTLGGISILLPFVWMILGSFKTPAEAYSWPPVWLPAKWDWTNYQQLFDTIPFGRMFFNSFWTSVVIASLNIISAAPAAYAFARLRFPGQNLWFTSHIVSMMIPWQVTIIPVFLMIRRLGWYDSYTALIVPSIASGFTVFLLYQYFRTLPRSLEESVLVDGGSWFTALLHIALPASRPAMAAAWLFAFLGNWQAFIWPLIVLQTSEKMLLSVGLLSLQSQYSVNIPVLMAGTTLATLRRLAALAHAHGGFFEAEYEVVGKGERAAQQHDDLEGLSEFAQASGCDLLAVNIGTQHKQEQKVTHLDFERLAQIAALTPLPLVLHGSSGVPEDQLSRAVKMGISKVNIATDLTLTFTQAVQQSLSAGAKDPRKYLGAGRDAMQARAAHYLQILGSAGKA